MITINALLSAFPGKKTHIRKQAYRGSIINLNGECPVQGCSFISPNTHDPSHLAHHITQEHTAVEQRG
eukprot:15341578-Ditylum_brightwellii.AAC.1